MKINHKALLVAGMRAVAVLFVLELVLEHATWHLLGLSVKAELPNASFGFRFSSTYFALTGIGLMLILYAYAVIRHSFSSRLRAGLATSGFFFLYTMLLMTQQLNFGLISGRLYFMTAAFSLIELPLVLSVGILSYREPANQLTIRPSHP